MIQSAITKQIEAIIAAYGITTPKTKNSRRLIQYGPRETPNKTVGLFDRFFELGEITSALSAPRQSFLFVATIIFVGCSQVKRSLPSDNIEGGRSDIQIWPTTLG
jgi:hypothetical protein